VRECGDFEVFSLDGFRIPFHLFEQRLNQRSHLGFGGRFQIELIKFGERIHRYYYTAIIRCKPYVYWVSPFFIACFARDLDLPIGSNGCRKPLPINARN
jgi:hypothetical protein